MSHPARRVCEVTAGVFSQTGLFVCFEGGEGAGKSTQARLLRRLARERRGTTSCSPSSPGTPRSARSCAGSCSTRRPATCPHRTEALLYAADKAEHVDQVVAARAGPRRGRDHRPLRRLDAGLPGRRAATWPSPRSSASRAGPPATCARTSPSCSTSTPQAGLEPVRGARPHRGASRSSSTSGCARCSSSWPPPTPTTTSWSTRARPIDEIAAAISSGSRRAWTRA